MDAQEPKELTRGQARAMQAKNNSSFKQLPKNEQNKVLQHQEAVRRLINRGVPADKIPEVLARERYEKLPVEKKIQHLEQLVSQLIRGFGKDLQDLHNNDSVLTEALDINFRAYSRLLLKAGVSLQDQHDELKRVQAEMAAEKEAKQKAKEEAATKARQESVKESLQEKVEAGPEEEAEVVLPEGARVFGGDSAEQKEAVIDSEVTSEG